MIEWVKNTRLYCDVSKFHGTRIIVWCGNVAVCVPVMHLVLVLRGVLEMMQKPRCCISSRCVLWEERLKFNEMVTSDFPARRLLEQLSFSSITLEDGTLKVVQETFYLSISVVHENEDVIDRLLWFC